MPILRTVVVILAFGRGPGLAKDQSRLCLRQRKVGEAELDRVIDSAGSDMNAERRAGLIAQAQRRAQRLH